MNPSPDDQFWKEVCAENIDHFEQSRNQDTNSVSGTNEGSKVLNSNSNSKHNPKHGNTKYNQTLEKMKTQCKEVWTKMIQNDIVKWMLIFFIGTLIVSFIVLISINPPLVQVNKKLDKRRSALKILGFSILFGVIASILVPIAMKIWEKCVNGTNKSKNKTTKGMHPLTPHLELTPL